MPTELKEACIQLLQREVSEKRHYRPSPVKLSPLGEKVRGGQYHVRQKGGTISRTVGGWPFWCEEGGAKVVPATPLKLPPPALKLSVGAKYRFFGGDNFTGEGRQKKKKKKKNATSSAGLALKSIPHPGIFGGFGRNVFFLQYGDFIKKPEVLILLSKTTT